MKILVWCSSVSIGGGARLLANLLPAMAEQEEVDYIYLVIHPMSRLKEKIPSSRQNKLKIFYANGPVSKPLHVLAKQFDIVYCCWPHGLPYQPAGKPIVCTFQDTTIFDCAIPFLTHSDIKSAWIQSNVWLENCSIVVAPSYHVKSRLIANFGEQCERAVVIPHAISPGEAFAGERLSPELSGILPEEYIVYPSNISFHKNHYNLFLAYSKFSHRKQYPLVLCGHLTDKLRVEAREWRLEEASLPTLVSLIKRTGLQIGEDLFPLGYVNDIDVNLLIKNAKALIMPSLSEGGGSYPVEEALSLGTPVLCSDIPVMREHLANRTAKILWFDPKSPLLIVKALEEIAINYDEYKKSAIAGRFDTRPTWHDVAKEYLQVFKTAIHAYHDY